MCAFLKYYKAVLSCHSRVRLVHALVVSDIKVPVGSSGFANASLGRFDLSNAVGRRWHHLHGMDVEYFKTK